MCENFISECVGYSHYEGQHTPSLRAIAWQSKELDCFVPRNDGEISSMTGEVPRNDDF
jgi:hypothetical protein